MEEEYIMTPEQREAYHKSLKKMSISTGIFCNREEKLKENLERLEEIKKLCNKPNWNGYDAQIISQRTIDKTKELLENFIFSPKIVPTGRGSIQVEWTSLNKYFEIEIFEDVVEFWVDEKSWQDKKSDAELKYYSHQDKEEGDIDKLIEVRDYIENTLFDIVFSDEYYDVRDIKHILQILNDLIEKE